MANAENGGAEVLVCRRGRPPNSAARHEIVRAHLDGIDTAAPDRMDLAGPSRASDAMDFSAMTPELPTLKRGVARARVEDLSAAYRIDKHA